MSDVRATTLATVEELARLGASFILLDIQDEASAESAARPRIPGAQLAYLGSDFAGASTKTSGRRPLPDIAALQARARQWGIGANSRVIVYDDNNGSQAARAWWTLRWAGVENVRLLDGGLGAWRAAGHPLTTSSPTLAAGDIVLSPGHMPTLDADGAATLARDGVLLDARARTAFIGAPTEPGKPGQGHIPGAISAPSGDNLSADGHFKSAEDLRARFAALGVDGETSIGVYCGSGVAASHEIVALNVAGLQARLYVGSWSAWSADPARPVAIGEK